MQADLILVAGAWAALGLAWVLSRSATVRIWQLTRSPSPWARWRQRRRVRRSTALALASCDRGAPGRAHGGHAPGPAGEPT